MARHVRGGCPVLDTRLLAASHLVVHVVVKAFFPAGPKTMASHGLLHLIADDHRQITCGVSYKNNVHFGQSPALIISPSGMFLALGMKVSDLLARDLVRGVTSLTVPFSSIPTTPKAPKTIQHIFGEISTLAYLTRYIQLSIPGVVAYKQVHSRLFQAPSALHSQPYIYILRDLATIPPAAFHILTMRLTSWVAIGLRPLITCLLLKLGLPSSSIIHSHDDISIAVTPTLGDATLRLLSKLDVV